MKNKLLTNWLALFFVINHLCFCARADEAGHGNADAKVWKKNREAGQEAMKQQRTAEAETLFRTALAEAEKFDARDYRLAESLEDLGGLYLSARNPAAAEPLLRRALAIRRNDPNRLTEAQCLVDLGCACQALQQFDEAEKYFLEARTIVDKEFGSDHPLDVRLRFDLGVLYQQRGDYARAEPLFKEALVLFSHPASRTKFQMVDPSYGSTVARYSFRPDDTYTLNTLIHLGEIYAAQKLPDKAESSFKEAAKLAEKRSPADLEKFFRLEIAVYDRSFGPSHPLLVVPLQDYARFLRKQKRDAEAEAQETRVRSISMMAAGK